MAFCILQAQVRADIYSVTTTAETLNSGNFTAIVRGNGNTSGVALVEVYHVQ